MSQLLLDERPVVLQPSLIAALGFEMATVLQQVHWYLQNPKSGREIDGEKWIYNSYKQWRENDFPFWTEQTVQKWFLKLEKKGLLVSCQPNKDDWDRTKHYRIDYKKLSSVSASVRISSNICERISSEVCDDTSSEVCERIGSYKEAKTSTKTSTKKERNFVSLGAAPSAGANVPDIPSGKQSKPKRPKPEPDSRKDHWAIKTIRECTQRYPEKILWDDIIKATGEKDQSQKLTACIKVWLARGFNKNNSAGYINWFKKGIPEQRKPQLELNNGARREFVQ